MQNASKLRRCGHITFRMQQNDHSEQLSRLCLCLTRTKLTTSCMPTQHLARLDMRWSKAATTAAPTNGQTGPRNCTTRRRHMELILSGGVVAQTVALPIWRCGGARSREPRSLPTHLALDSHRG